MAGFIELAKATGCRLSVGEEAHVFVSAERPRRRRPGEGEERLQLCLSQLANGVAMKKRQQWRNLK